MKDVKDAQVYDVAIVGGGPAGLSAAIWLARYLHSVVVVDSGDPRNWETRGVNGFLGQPKVRPAELREMGREECRKYGVTLVDAIVDTVTREAEERFVIRAQGQPPIAGRRLLLAIGLRDLWPDIPGLEHVYGKNAHVCPDCDGYECRDRKTVVIGNGRAAVGLALNLTTWTSDIIICTNGEPAAMDRDEYCHKLDALNIPVITDRVTCVKADGNSGIYSLELEGGKCMDADKLFFKLGQIPADDLAAQLGCERDEEGQVIVDDAMHTSVLNVFAAGDIVPGPQIAIGAAADGAIAALAIHKSLVPEDRKLQKLGKAAMAEAREAEAATR